MKSGKTDQSITIAELTDAVWQHVSERGWDKNAPRGLAISIALEANELLEHYQWQDEPVGDKKELAHELADILIYCLQFAKQYDIDLSSAIRDKLAVSAKKYPAEAFGKDKTSEERRQAWVAAKANHKKEGIL